MQYYIDTFLIKTLFAMDTRLSGATLKCTVTSRDVLCKALKVLTWRVWEPLQGVPITYTH